MAWSEQANCKKINHDEVEQLRAEVGKLQSELASLKENVIIESMNQMKEDYRRICRSAICVCERARLLKKILDLKRNIIAIEATSYSLYESFNEVMGIVRASKSEIQGVEWTKLRKTLKHVDHVLLHLTDLCDDAEAIKEPEPEPDRCICENLLADDIFDDPNLLQLAFRSDG